MDKLFIRWYEIPVEEIDNLSFPNSLSWEEYNAPLV